MESSVENAANAIANAGSPPVSQDQREKRTETVRAEPIRTDDEIREELKDRVGNHHSAQAEGPIEDDRIDDSQEYQAISFQKIQEDLAKNYEITQEQHYYLNAKSSEIFEAKQILDEQYQNVNWSALKESDPQRYMILQHEFKDAYERVQNDYTTLQELASTQKQRVQDQYQKHLNEQMAMVKRMIPSWQNPETMKKETDIIRADLIKHYGYTDEELDQIYDSRLVRVLRDLVKYKQAARKRASDNRANAKKRAESKPRDDSGKYVKGSTDWAVAKLKGRM